jgi:MFS-type transporter involved in bile tolerance (Atg22 family)
MGPIVWGITVYIFGKLGYDIIKYRFGVASMLLLMLIGFTILIKVPDKKRP